MKISFNLGKDENHEVDYEFNQIWGITKIFIDGKRIKWDFSMFTTDLLIFYDFDVQGSNETFKVSIERERKLFLAGFRKQVHRVYVNDTLLQELEGY
jgi:hypothetical protein